MKAYSWPGNVRELRNVIERIMILEDGPRVPVDALPIELVESPSEPARLQGVATARDTSRGHLARGHRARIDSAGIEADQRQSDTGRGAAGDKSRHASVQDEKARLAVDERGLTPDVVGEMTHRFPATQVERSGETPR